jgi:RNA polymerase sigma-70 factor, ECF subfamily
MRSVIIDEARNEGAAKRGKGWRRIPLSEAGGDGAAPGLDVLDIEEALLALERSHPRAARVLELRVFGGLGTAQTAALLRLSDRTVESELRFARAMLRVRLDPLSNRS